MSSLSRRIKATYENVDQLVEDVKHIKLEKKSRQTQRPWRPADSMQWLVSEVGILKDKMEQHEV